MNLLLMKIWMTTITACLAVLLQTMDTHAQITVLENVAAVELARRLAGPGVTILNPVLTCPGAANMGYSAHKYPALGSIVASCLLPAVQLPALMASA
jgi:hypothetical protein